MAAREVLALLCLYHGATALHLGAQRQLGAEGAVRVSSAVEDEAAGPMAYTELGAIRGAHKDGYDLFAKIPYAEPPERFGEAAPKLAWAPQEMNGTDFGPGCIGSHTGVPEDEDCLHLNIWTPTGGRKGMPVIIYFHGGMNQHGSSSERFRHGDKIVQIPEYPVVFVNFDYRLGILGWIFTPPDAGVRQNLGFLDQIRALQWVHRHISAFGGDPNQVTLQGQSEGAHNILLHLVSPLSAGLFHQVAFHSPPASMWSRNANMERTKFIVGRTGCTRTNTKDTMDCLRALPAQVLWAADWVSEEMSRSPGSPYWIQSVLGMALFSLGKPQQEMPQYLGWHAVIDGIVLPGDPRELIPQGKWNQVPALITVSKNESLGVFPGTDDSFLKMALKTLLKEEQFAWIKHVYNLSLAASGIIVPDDLSLLHQMVTDKMWTCDARSLARDMVKSGGLPHVEMFWHSPKYDPIGSATNKICEHGATCHAAEMLYVLPQGRGQGIHGPDMEQEIEFAQNYSRDFAGFVHGFPGPWSVYDSGSVPVTFYSTNGTRTEEGYRAKQCEVLDLSMGKTLPLYMQLEGYYNSVYQLTKPRPPGNPSPIR